MAKPLHFLSFKDQELLKYSIKKQLRYNLPCVKNAINNHESSFLFIDNHSIISTIIKYDLNLLKHGLRQFIKTLSIIKINAPYKNVSLLLFNNLGTFPGL